MEHKGTRPIHTERLLLRRIVPEDAEAVFEWMRDPEVCLYERWTPHESVAYSRGYIRAVFDYASDKTYQWGIEFEGRLIGSVSVVNVDDYDRKAVMGYCLARAYWGRGIVTEAVKAVLGYMFGEVGINRIEASHSVNNPASGKVMRKAGLRKEGFAPSYYFSNAGFQDSDLYGLTREQYYALSRG